MCFESLVIYAKFDRQCNLENNKMTKTESEITEIVNRETRAWDTQDVDLLISIFHPDMVWPWSKTSKSHDPCDWEYAINLYFR